MVASTVDAPVVSDAPLRHVLYQHFVVTEGQIGPTVQRSFAALYQRIGQSGVTPAGPPFAIYNTVAPPFDMFVCAPVASPTAPSDEFRFMEMPASRVVSLLHVGPYEQIERAYDVVEAYIRENGLTATGAPRETYLSPPNTPAAEIHTIIEWPIA